MSRTNGFDFRGALGTPATAKFHFLYDMDCRQTLKLRNCDVAEGAFAPIASWQPITQNGNLIFFDYLYINRHLYVHLSKVYDLLRIQASHRYTLNH